MKRFAKAAACLLAGLSTATMSAQQPSAQRDSTSALTPAAYIYVATNPSRNNYQINAYKAASDGSLARIAGSPFGKSNNTYAATANTAHWLFVSDGISIHSFSIAANGAVQEVASINAQQYDNFPGSLALTLFLDHTGTTLYDVEIDGIGDNLVQFFDKNSTTGALTYFGSSDPSAYFGSAPAFTGNNLYAYGSTCFQLSAAFYGFLRNSDGSLTRLSLSPPIPINPNGAYCPTLAAADPASNLAIPMYPETGSGPPLPPIQLAVYTADSSGNLTTNSTSQDMPKTAIGFINDIVASPAGDLLAVAGTKGLQVFHFNGSNPITPYTGLLTPNNIWKIHWDDHNHLYAISETSAQLFVFTVTATSYSQAPGSPHKIPTPLALSVLSK